MGHKQDDFLIKRKEKAPPADEAVFTWFGPPDSEDRYRFLVTREDGESVSVLPSTDGRFKKGLLALRWDEAEGGTPTTYLTVKTTGRRIDLVKVK